MLQIQPQHLHEHTRQEYRREFQANSARVVVMREVLKPAVADAVSRFLEREVEYRRVYGLQSRHETYVDVREEDWRVADESDRFFTYSVFGGVRPEHRLSENLLVYLQVCRALVDREFTTFIENIADVLLGDSEFHVHAMKAGDFLKPHRDGKPERRLASVLFLSRNWNPCFGGDLHFVDAGLELAVVKPVFNSMAVFDVTTPVEHYVAPISEAAGDWLRLTMSGWFLQPPAV